MGKVLYIIVIFGPRQQKHCQGRHNETAETPLDKRREHPTMKGNRWTGENVCSSILPKQFICKICKEPGSKESICKICNEPGSKESK